jgi:hypothetical protein
MTTLIGEGPMSSRGQIADRNSPSRPWRLLMGSSARTYTVDQVEVGTLVTVRNRYLGSWATGFEVAKLLDDGYILRRVSDGAVLPEVVTFDDVMRATAT